MIYLNFWHSMGWKAEFQGQSFNSQRQAGCSGLSSARWSSAWGIIAAASPLAFAEQTRANSNLWRSLSFFSALSYQLLWFHRENWAYDAFAWQGAKSLCLGTVALYFSLYGGHARNGVSQDPYRDQLFCLLDWLFSLSAHSENATEVVTGFQWGVIQIPVFWACKTEQIWAFAFFQKGTQKLLSGAFIRIM